MSLQPKCIQYKASADGESDSGSWVGEENSPVDGVLSADEYDWNLSHVSVMAHLAVVGVNRAEAHLVLHTEH